MHRVLADRLGQVPDGPFGGLPRYMLKQIRDLKIPGKVETTPSGLTVIHDDYTWVPQIDGSSEKWCLAKWQPSPPKEEWDLRYGEALGYPYGGYWYCFQPFRDGYEPTEDWVTGWLVNNIAMQEADSIKDLNNMSQLDKWKLRRKVDEVKEAYRKEQKAFEDEIVKRLREDCWTDHVHGTHSGPYLAFNEPAEKKEEVTDGNSNGTD